MTRPGWVFAAGAAMPLAMMLPVGPWVDTQLDGRVMTLLGPLLVGLMLGHAGGPMRVLALVALAALAGLAAALAGHTLAFRLAAGFAQLGMVAMWAAVWLRQDEPAARLAAAGCLVTSSLGMRLYVDANFLLPELEPWSPAARLVDTRTLGTPEVGPMLLMLTYAVLALAATRAARDGDRGT